MAHEPVTYDLMLLLASELPEDRSEKILADVETLIVEQGELLRSHDWGVRPMAYEIGKKPDASYHLIQFHGPSPLLAAIDHMLKITEGVVRHRVIKLKPGTPDPPEIKPADAAVAGAPAE